MKALQNAALLNLLVASLLGVCCVTNARAASIGLNFVDGRNGSGPEALGAGQSAGVVPQINWNNTEANSDNPIVGSKTTSDIASPTADTLVNSSGVNSGAMVSWTGETTWSAVDEGSPTADDILMSDYLLTENNSGPDASVTFSGLSYNSYDVYVYFAGSGAASGSNGTVTLNGTTDVDVQSLAFSGGPFVEATGGAQGNFVLFSDVIGSSVTVSLDADSGGGNFHMGIFGVQVVEVVPEPSAILLASIGVLALAIVFWRRRRPRCQ